MKRGPAGYLTRTARRALTLAITARAATTAR